MTGDQEHSSAGDAARPDGASAEGAALAVQLAATDLSSLNDHDAIEHAAEVERLVSWAISLRHDIYAELARRPMRPTRFDEDVDDEVRQSWAELGEHVREHASDELAARTSSTPRTIDLRMGLALALTRLPATAEALRSGRIDLARARVIVDGLACLDDEVAVAAESRWAAQAEHLTPSRLRRLVRREALQIDSDAARKREVQAHEERRVVVTPADDGMAELWALLRPRMPCVFGRC